MEMIVFYTIVLVGVLAVVFFFGRDNSKPHVGGLTPA